MKPRAYPFVQAAVRTLLILLVSTVAWPAASQGQPHPPPHHPPPAPPSHPPATPVAAPPTFPAAGDALITPPEQRADDLHRKAKPLVAENRWEEAVVMLEEAYKLKPSHDIASNYAAVLFALDRYREAAEVFRVAATKLPTDLSPEKRKRFDLLSSSARGEVAIVRVRTAAIGATIKIDGQPVGQSPIDHELFLDPGEHTFVAELNGQSTIVVTRVLLRTDDKTIELGALGAGSAIPTGAIVLGVIGFATLIAGSAFIVVSTNARSDYEEREQSIIADGGMRCQPPTTPGFESRCGELADLRDSNNNVYVPAAAVFFSASALTLGAAVLWEVLADNSSPNKKGSVMLTPTITPTHQGLSITGHF